MDKLCFDSIKIDMYVVVELNYLHVHVPSTVTEPLDDCTTYIALSWNHKSFAYCVHGICDLCTYSMNFNCSNETAVFLSLILIVSFDVRYYLQVEENENENEIDAEDSESYYGQPTDVHDVQSSWPIKFTTRESFSEAVIEVWKFFGIDILHWVVCIEAHANLHFESGDDLHYYRFPWDWN